MRVRDHVLTLKRSLLGKLGEMNKWLGWGYGYRGPKRFIRDLHQIRC